MYLTLSPTLNNVALRLFLLFHHNPTHDIRHPWWELKYLDLAMNKISSYNFQKNNIRVIFGYSYKERVGCVVCENGVCVKGTGRTKYSFTSLIWYIHRKVLCQRQETRIPYSVRVIFNVPCLIQSFQQQPQHP